MNNFLNFKDIEKEDEVEGGALGPTIELKEEGSVPSSISNDTPRR